MFMLGMLIFCKVTHEKWFEQKEIYDKSEVLSLLLFNF